MSWSEATTVKVCSESVSKSVSLQDSLSGVTMSVGSIESVSESVNRSRVIGLVSE